MSIQGRRSSLCRGSSSGSHGTMLGHQPPRAGPKAALPERTLNRTTFRFAAPTWPTEPTSEVPTRDAGSGRDLDSGRLPRTGA